MSGKQTAGSFVKCMVVVSAALVLGACASTPTPNVTSVGKSVATYHKSDVMAGCTTVPTGLDPQAWWNAMPAANRQYPVAGWETWRNVTGGCANTRVDAYRAVTTFNLASVAHLKGLVQKAELVVATRALAPAARQGGVVTAGPFGQTGSVTLFCPRLIGGMGALVRFGPNAAIPTTTAAGDFTMLGAAPFPSGTNVVYTLPPSFTPGPITGAANPSTVAPTGDGRATITTDVTGAVTAALNADATGMTWMLTSNFEGPLPGQLPDGGSADCRTSYDLELRITHL